jgi:glycosyltransferase involved in cell wall biosynthesis
MRIIALLAVFNEERFIANCLENLFQQGAEVYLLDNDCTDQTVAIARRHLGRGLLGVERFPREGVFRSWPILRRKEQLQSELLGDWFLHVDADEVHTPGRYGRTLAEVFTMAQAEGYNAINFQEYTFTPTQEQPDHDHPDYQETMRWYYPFAPAFPHRLNAWQKQPAVSKLADSGGHAISFPGLRRYPESLVMRHYLFLSKDHAVCKFVRQSYAAEEVKKGWYGNRALLKPELIKLPKQAELRPYASDEKLDPSNPLKKHLLLDF